jgi:NADH-quinone oxidoreductase subunit L
MEGPDTVSALIRGDDGHRGRLHEGLPPVADVRDEPVALTTVVTSVSAATCLFAATCRLVQTDIKRIDRLFDLTALATCSSQLRASARTGTYSTLFTHAFFRRCCSLGGSVVHAMHHEQDVTLLWRPA